MPKIKLRYTLKTKDNKIEEVVSAITRNNEYLFKENNETTVVYNYKENVLKRENDELKMEFDFNNNKASYYIKEYNKELILNIKTNKIENKKDKIIIDYKVEDEKQEYILEVIK